MSLEKHALIAGIAKQASAHGLSYEDTRKLAERLLNNPFLQKEAFVVSEEPTTVATLEQCLELRNRLTPCD